MIGGELRGLCLVKVGVHDVTGPGLVAATENVKGAAKNLWSLQG